jgi:hypothetical protein
MTTFRSIGEAIDYFDEKAILFQKFLEEHPDDKAVQEVTRTYVEWRIFTVNFLKSKGYETAAKFVNSLRSNNDGQLFLVPSRQLF